jgi:GT2 family glycosyltransferase
MDADDISYPNRLEKQLEYIESNPDCDIVSTNRDDIDENSNIIRKATAIIVKDEAIPKILKYGSIITHPSVMIKAELLKKINGYRAFKSSQDYDLWLRMVSKGCKFHILPQVLIKYRIRQNSITKSNYARSYFCHKYIRQLFFERKSNNGLDSFKEYYLDRILNLPLRKTEPINQQYIQIMSLSTNKIQPIKIIKFLSGIIQNKDCFLNFKNMLIAKLLIKYSKVKICAE